LLVGELLVCRHRVVSVVAVEIQEAGSIVKNITSR
jgi:hypothetical protein